MEAKGATAGMRVFPLQRVPEQLVIAAYGRYGCPICRIGEPDEERLSHWLEHAQREHGYEVVSDSLEAAPRIPELGLRFRVLRLRHLFTRDTDTSTEARADASANDER